MKNGLPKVIAVIPARYASSRFPGKLLHKIAGKPLLQWTYENALRCQALDQVVIAADSEEIRRCVASFGGKVTMTGPCASGTERVAQAVANDNLLKHADIVVNIQGDEPLVEPALIEQIVEAIREGSSCATPIVRISSEEEARNPSVVKCVVDIDGNALYFSRALIPANKTLSWDPSGTYFRHIGIYGFERDFLQTYVNLTQTPLQTMEDLEQLKILENGYRIKTVLVDSVSIGVDTPEDVQQMEQYLCKQNISSSREGSAPPLAKG